MEDLSQEKDKFSDQVREREIDLLNLQQQKAKEKEKLALWEREHETVLRGEYDKVKKLLEVSS